MTKSDRALDLQPVRVGLFVTCLTDTFFPRVGAAVFEILRHLGCEVVFPLEQTCCGQPAFNSGFRDEARLLLERLPAMFEGADYVVTPSGSCAAMVVEHGRELCLGPRGDAFEAFAKKTWEFVSFLHEVLRVDWERFHLSRGAGAVSVHYPCHLRPLLAEKTMTRLAERIFGDRLKSLERLDQCCGFGGTFSVDSPEISDAMLEDKLGCIGASGARVLICNEAGCTLQIEGGLHRRGDSTRVVHLAEAMAEGLGISLPVG